MTQPYPLPRSYRETDELAFDGSSMAYGPFGAPSTFDIFDEEDVLVKVKPEGGDWADETVLVTKTGSDTLSSFTIQFTTVHPSTSRYKVFGHRLHERSLDVQKGTSLSADKLELELSKQGAVLQELRRDVDVTSDASSTAVLAAAAAQTDRQAADAAAAAAAADAAAAAASANAGYLFDTRTAVSTATVPASIAAVTWRGYAAIADGGGAQATRQATPATPTVWDVQSHDGAWWRVDPAAHPLALGAKGDGATNDTALFTAYEAVVTGKTIDLKGKTYVVDALPAGNVYVNGFWLISGVLIDAATAPELISAGAPTSYDTGGLEAAYTGGIYGAPVVMGRSTPKMTGVLWSQNSRAFGHPRSGVIAGIYAFASGLCSLVLGGRQSSATMPESVVIGSEESYVDTGSRNTLIAVINGIGEGVGAAIAGARTCIVSGWEAFVGGSNACTAGAGSGARFRVNVSAAGIITSIDILSGGSKYTQTTMEITDRVGTGSGASATAVLTNGVVTGITGLVGGTGYSTVVGAVNARMYSNRSMAVLGSNQSTARGNQSLVGASVMSDALGDQSAVIASGGAAAQGANSAAIACGLTTGATGPTDTVVSGAGASAISTSTGTVSGANSSMIASIISTLSALRGMVIGSRRVINNVDQTIVGGTASSGDPLTSNIKWRLNSAAGTFELTGVVTANKVFTDLAKMFENLIAGVAIPVGALVAWEGRKVRLARPGDVTFSVHSRCYAQLLGDTTTTWAGRYLYSEYGEHLTETIPDPDWPAEIPDPAWPALVVNPAHPVIETLTDADGQPVKDADGNVVHVVTSAPLIANPLPAPLIANPSPQPTITQWVENPAFDPTAEQVPRSQRRDDWTPVTLVGEVFTNVTADVGVDDYVEPVAPGIGGKASGVTGLRCMAIMTPYDATRGYAIALCLKL